MPLYVHKIPSENSVRLGSTPFVTRSKAVFNSGTGIPVPGSIQSGEIISEFNGKVRCQQIISRNLGSPCWLIYRMQQPNYLLHSFHFHW